MMIRKKLIPTISAAALFALTIFSSAQQVTVPVNPGFTPEQAAAMEAQIRQSKSSDVLYPKDLPVAEQTRAVVRIEGNSGGRRWCGIGSTPATAMERQLMHYPQPIQDDILDWMFKPNFGMALTHLKVEVGGDNNSTAAVEPSFAHTREEMQHPNFHRGGNFWLMRKARDRNPGLELGALAWTQPYWVGNGAGNTNNKSFFTPESAEYFVKFYEGARNEWGLEMQYFSAEQNERHPGGQKEWILHCLRPAFDKAGFPHVGFVIDNGGWPLRDDYKTPEFLKQIAALGRHYVENSPKHIAPRDIQELGIPLWNAEGWSRVGQTWPLAIYFAESVARGYVDSKVTQFTTWPILAGGLPGSLYGTTGLMLANKPWSGYYEIYPTVWITAHFNQFAPMGWKTVDGGCGGLFVESNPKYDSWTLGSAGEKDAWKRARLNYVTLASPDGKDYSIILVNTSPFARTLDVALQNLPAKALHVWRSTETEQFVHIRQIAPANGKFTLGIEPWTIYSLTTTTGQQKGQPRNPVPADNILPLPYKDDFESYPVGADARYTSSSAGYFEVAQIPGEGKTLRQAVPAKGLTWSIPKDNYPCVAIGDVRWNDYEVSSDAHLEGSKGDMALWARVSSFRDHGMAGYYLRVDQEGKWELGVAKNRYGPNNFYTEKPLANGHLPQFKADAWHKLALLADGSQLRGSIDGAVVAEVQDGTWAAGAVGYSTWAEGIQKDYEDMKSAMVIGLKYGQARFDNLLVRPVPGKLSQAGWKAVATSQHEGSEAGKAIDGDPKTFWHSEYNSKGPLPQAVTVDLGKPQRVKEVRVLQRQDGGRSYITKYTVYLSRDGRTFAKASEGQWEDNAAMKAVAIAPQSARYVRIEAQEASGGRKSNVSIAEVQVVAAESP